MQTEEMREIKYESIIEQSGKQKKNFNLTFRRKSNEVLSKVY